MKMKREKKTNLMPGQTMKLPRKRREAKKDKNFRKKFNKEFQKAVRRDMK